MSNSPGAKVRHSCPPTDSCAVAKAERSVVRAAVWFEDNPMRVERFRKLERAVERLRAAQRRAKESR